MTSPIFLLAWAKEPADAPPVIREMHPPADNPQALFKRAHECGRYQRVVLAHQFQEGGRYD